MIIRHCRPISKRKRFELERVVASPLGERLVARQHLAERAAALGASVEAFQMPAAPGVSADAGAAEVEARSGAGEGGKEVHAAPGH